MGRPSLMETALTYAARGLADFPLAPRRKEPLGQPSVECASKSILGGERLSWLTELAEELLGEPRVEHCAGCGQSHLSGGQGLPPQYAEMLLQRANQRFCSPPVEVDEIAKIVSETAARELQRIREAP